jgi:hypothetical protein
MKKHLYKLKPCPPERNDIALNDDIKEIILRDRLYRIQQPSNLNVNVNTPVINQQLYLTNNIGTIMNFITPKMTDMDRLLMYLEYKDKEPVCLCDDIDRTYGVEHFKM